MWWRPIFFQGSPFTYPRKILAEAFTTELRRFSNCIYFYQRVLLPNCQTFEKVLGRFETTWQVFHKKENHGYSKCFVHKAIILWEKKQIMLRAFWLVQEKNNGKKKRERKKWKETKEIETAWSNEVDKKKKWVVNCSKNHPIE